MLNENSEFIYEISFTLEEIKPLVLLEIEQAQDIQNSLSLYRLRNYIQYHETLEEYFKKYKNKKPSKAEKLAYIILLSYPKKYIIQASTFDDFKLFQKNNEEKTDFRAIEEIRIEHNEFDEFDGEHIDCICSKINLKYVTIVENKHSLIPLHVGSECIKKYKIISIEEIKKMNEINAMKKEREKEIKQGLPAGYYDEKKRLEKIKKMEKMEKKIIIENKIILKKINSGNYKMCYFCDKSLLNIKNDKSKRICENCIKRNFNGNNLIELWSPIMNELNVAYNEYCCNNCDSSFISLLSKNEYLCKKCVKENKVIICKICVSPVLLDINSTDSMCDICEAKLSKCVDCNEIFIKELSNSLVNRCKTCQLCYENKMILQKCYDCKDEFVKKEKEYWRTYCQECFKNIEFPNCKCNQKMVQRIVKKEGLNKGKKFYVCKESKCNEFIWG
jgi:hypothetical protein